MSAGEIAERFGCSWPTLRSKPPSACSRRSPTHLGGTYCSHSLLKKHGFAPQTAGAWARDDWTRAGAMGFVI